MARAAECECTYNLDYLRKILKPGDTVYTTLRNVSRSGMTRHIDVYVMVKNEPVNVSYHVAEVIRNSRAKDGSVKIGGCGMDMGFEMVYNLSHYMYPDGFGCIGKGCPSNDHTNGDRDYTPNGGIRKGRHQTHWHKSGGYALRHRWM